jgi:Phospholipase B
MSLARKFGAVLNALFVACAAAQPAAFAPDPATVQRYGAGYRYPQEGWIVLHIEGAPYERGVQHGRLMAPEIERYMRCYATMQTPGAPADGWKLMRTIVSTSFLRGFDKEYLEEMQGIADGASAAGARFDDRPLDLTDVAAMNLWAELMTLDDANAATPTGLEGKDFKDPKAKEPGRNGTRNDDAPSRPVTPKTAPARCSAFAATGKATKDGHAIIGHITMFGLYPSGFFNVWLDVKPESGHRVMMQSYPAGIYSGMDYYLNDAGIAMVETTIDQTRFDFTGVPLASRARSALQYGSTIDDVVTRLRGQNNGLYNNEWLIADFKTDEIAMYELGTRAGKLWRSSKDEWWGGTSGFYWGCNNTKDLGVRMETIPAANDRPANMVWSPTDRDLKWVELYKANAGKMDEQFAKTAFTTPPLCSSAAVDAKFTTGTLAKNLQSWAIFGPPLGRTWMPTNEEIKKYKDVRPLVSNPWTILGPGIETPATDRALPMDLPDPAGDRLIGQVDPDDKDKEPATKPAWHGTILPAGDGDIWLASAFAEYEKMVSEERGYAATQPNKCLCADDWDKVASSLFGARARYFAGVRAGGDVALAAIKPDTGTDAWFKVASGKGVLVLAELRREMGDQKFLDLMDDFGRAHAGAAASTSEFAAAASTASGRDLSEFFKYWTGHTGLPQLDLLAAEASPDSNAAPEDEPGSVVIKGKLKASGGPLPSSIEMTLEQGDEELTQVVALGKDGAFEIPVKGLVDRLVVDKYARAARANGGEAEVGAFTSDLAHTLIVYGTADDAAANHEAAEAFAKIIRTGWANVELPLVSDGEVTDAQLTGSNLVLIGRPRANGITRRMADALPVSFGSASFSARGDMYANCMSAVVAAAVSPVNPHRSITVIAGNSAAGTLARASAPLERGHQPEVVISEASGRTVSIVVPAPELVKDFGAERTVRGK